MVDQPRPEEIAGRTFRHALRGYDPEEVAAFLADVAEDVRLLVEQRDRLAARLGDLGSRDLRAEFDAVSREVGQVLESAREAAEAMRERAGADAARWRSEAVAEAEAERRRARADAEQLRGDAWSTGEELLRHCQRQAEETRRDAERDAITVLGEAEREARRISAGARRDADDLVRSARMEAERLTVEAQGRHDELIEAARRQAEAAQERTRALEQRRDELMRELESVKGALSRVEGDMEGRREELGLSQSSEPSSTVKVVPREARGEAHDRPWEPGETVRVIRPGGGRPAGGPPPAVPVEPQPAVRIIPAGKAKPPAEPELPAVEDESSAVAGEVESVPEVVAAEEDVPAAPTPEVVEEEPPVEEAPTPEEAEEEPPVEEAETSEEEPAPPLEEADIRTEGGGDAVPGPPLDDLFARLRTPGEEAEQAAAAESAVPTEEPAPARPMRRASAWRVDPFELRERLLLPVSNRALRNVKRQLTEEQNVALEEIRLHEDSWVPSVAEVQERLRADLVVLLAEAFAAGHVAAGELAEQPLPRPPTPTPDGASGFAEALVEALRGVLEEGRAGGQGTRQLGAAVSRVFRAWRTDEAERRLADLASGAYHNGLAQSLEAGEHRVRWVVAGRGCASCRAAGEEEPPASFPPFHAGCGCTLAVE